MLSREFTTYKPNELRTRYITQLLSQKISKQQTPAKQPTEAVAL